MLNLKIILCLIVIFFVLFVASKSYAGTDTYQIISFADGVVKLSNKKEYCLAGIKINEGMESQAGEFIRNASRDWKVIVEPTPNTKNNVPCAVIYIFGNGDLNRSMVDEEGLLRGFTDVRVGFWNTRKGVAINLNKLLVKKGLALSE